jgi:hypothetical protein
MKRKNDSDSESDKAYSDSELDYSDRNIFLVLNQNDLMDLNVREKITNPKKKKKTKTDIKRDVILKEIKKLNDRGTGTSLLDRILFSNLPIETKSTLVSGLENSSQSDKLKFAAYAEKVIQFPYNTTKPMAVVNGDMADFLLKLRSNMDESIFGHYQTKEEIVDYVSSILRNPNAKGNILALQSSPGMGKCHAKDTEILMYDGSVKKIQDIEVGDKVMGDDSTPRNVSGLGNGRDTMYEICHRRSNIKYVVNSEHILCLLNKDKGILEIPVNEYIKFSPYAQRQYHGYTNAIGFIKKPTKRDPYEAGMDIEDDILEFKVNSFYIRSKFLHGVIDGYGIRHTDCVEIFLLGCYMKSVLFIARSLGYIASCSMVSDIPILTIRGNKLVYLKYPELYQPFTTDEEIVVTKLEEDEYYGMTIDGNCRYVMENMVVTHNTKFARALGKSLGLPFHQISLGGVNDPSILLGHEYTYVGSKPGRIYDAIIKSKCINPVIYLDECDKIPESKSTEMNGILTHLLDKEQNMDFRDNYIGDMPIDLSKALFIVSFNDPALVDPIVLNRLKVIKVKENTLDEKVQIVRNYTIKEICQNLNLRPQLFSITDDTIRHVIQKTNKEPGMRDINKNFQTIFNKINTKMLLYKVSAEKITKITKGFKNSSDLKYFNGQIVIDNGLVDGMLCSNFEELEPHLHFMYM